ncbi:MAG: hypothetical protein IPO87_10780 [Flavobacteriales bacterium]|nr:hypothetical protein [Flavobacteriales bacterium]
MKLLFISTNDHVPWGGSEVLWSKVAVALVASGHNVMASLQRWPEEPKPVAEVRTKGVQIHLRSRDKLVYTRVLRTWNAFRGGYLPRNTPTTNWRHWSSFVRIMVLSLGSHVDGKFVRFARALQDRSISYDAIVQLVHPFLVLSDEEADRLLEAYSGARHVVFVSDQNRETHRCTLR